MKYGMPRLGTAEVGLIVDASTVPRRRASAVRSLRSRNELLALPVGKSFRFPSFQFDVDGRGIHPVVRHINAALEAGQRPWDAAGWWVKANQGIEGAAPVTLLRSSAEHAGLLAAVVAVGESDSLSVRVRDLPQVNEASA